MLKLIFSLATLWWMILFLYIPACFGLIIIVLLQRGKGQGLAGAFGMGGGMDTIFGPRSSKSLPQKITYASAAVFMSLALIMSILSGRVGRPAAPELLADTPQVSLEALFDSSAPTDDSAPASATDNNDEAVDAEDTEEADAVIPAPAPPSLDSLFEITPENFIPVEDTAEEEETETPEDTAPGEATMDEEETGAPEDTTAGEEADAEEEADETEPPADDAPTE